MPSKMYNRARMTVTSTGTGALSLGVAVAGYQTFSSAGAQNSDTVSYTIEDGVNWEIGTGTFNSVAGTLSRTVTQSFNGTTYGTSAISVTTNAQVYITALAADIVVSGGALGTPSSATLTNATGLPLATGVTGTLPVANGGTGLTSLTAGRIPYGAGVSGTDPFGNSANLFWDAANSRLGIGTASPATILQISGANTPRLSIIDTTNNVEMQVLSDNTAGYVGTQTNHPTIFVANVSERMRITSTGTVNIVGAGTAGSTQAVSFNGSAPINSMVLDASGRLGIGITSPTATLHVKGGNTNNLKIDNDGSQYTEVDILNNGTIKAYCYWDNTNTNWHFRSLGSLQLITSGGSGATIDTSGNFGVGTSSPGYKLDVNGSTRTTGYTLIGQNVSAANISGATTDLNAVAAMKICNNGGDGLYFGQYSTPTSVVWMQGAYQNPTLATYSIAINPLGGNVGIGTSSPGAKLNVNGSIYLEQSSVIKVRYQSGSNSYSSNLGPFWLQLGNNGNNDFVAGNSVTGGYFRWYVNNTTDLTTQTNNGTLAMTLDASGNLLVGTTSQVGSALTSLFSGTANNTSYRPLSLRGGSQTIFGNRKTTSVSTSATVISAVNEWCNLVLVFGTDGTNRFCDLVLWAIGTGTVNTISSLSASGSPAARTYSQSSSTLRVAMASGTYSVHVTELTMSEV